MEQPRADASGPKPTAFKHQLYVVAAGITGVGFAVAVVLDQQVPHSVPPWALLLGALLGLVTLGAAVVSSRRTCPQCSAYAGVDFRGDLISSGPLHRRADGQADRRYKHNPIVELYEKKARCKSCDHTWLR